MNIFPSIFVLFFWHLALSEFCHALQCKRAVMTEQGDLGLKMLGADRVKEQLKKPCASGTKQCMALFCTTSGGHAYHSWACSDGSVSEEHWGTILGPSEASAMRGDVGLWPKDWKCTAKFGGRGEDMGNVRFEPTGTGGEQNRAEAEEREWEEMLRELK